MILSDWESARTANPGESELENADSVLDDRNISCDMQSNILRRTGILPPFIHSEGVACDLNIFISCKTGGLRDKFGLIEESEKAASCVLLNRGHVASIQLAIRRAQYQSNDVPHIQLYIHQLWLLSGKPIIGFIAG